MVSYKRNQAAEPPWIAWSSSLSEAKSKSPSASLHQDPPQPETSWSREVELEKENPALKEQVNLLKVGQRRLEDELIKTEANQRQVSTISYLAFSEKLSETESELKSVERMRRREEQQLATVKV